MAFLKLVRWVLTALLVIALLVNLGDGFFAIVSIGTMVTFSLLALWLVPRVFSRERSRSTRSLATFREGFEPEMRHENIALDPHSDAVWIRDASGAERYLERGDMLRWKSAHDWSNGTFRQRIEIDVNDVQRPRWHVLFQRHSDTWKRTSKLNGDERDEWFARLRAWEQRPQSYAAKAKAAGVDTSLPGLHRHYYQATNDEQRHNYLVAFDIGCLTEQLDQKTEWERLGGNYPGPSEDLLKFKRA